MRLVFWISALTVVYVYAGYPLLLAGWARLRPRRAPRPAAPGDDLPTVSIVIAARNESARLPARIENLLALDYPADRRQIIVVSDGSTDDTLGVLARFGPAVEAIDGPAGGKAASLNIGVARATGTILIFADARQMFAPDALRELVSPFADPEIGGVTGELLLDCEASEVAGRRAGLERRHLRLDRRSEDRGPGRRLDGERRGRIVSTIADGVGLYWTYEKRLRQWESSINSTLGATGAIYALRRSLFRPLPDQTILDDVLTPMRAVLDGYRVVFSSRAFAFDRAALDADAEQRRKIRTLAGNVQILSQEPRLLVPFVNPVWLQYVSHKIGRLIVPFALLALFAATIPLSGQAAIYTLALIAQCALYLLAGYGAWLEHRAAQRGQLPSAPPVAAERIVNA